MLRLFVFSVALAVAIGLPLENTVGDKVLENGMYQGDIAGVDPNSDRNAMTTLNKLWPNGKVYYQIDSSATSIADVIHKAMKQYKEKTNGCIEFIDSKGDGNYLNIYRGNGCWSLVGKQGNGKQPVSLGRGCQYVGLAVHELGHAIGFWHEQNRSDRDDYIEVHLEHVQKAMRYNFDKLKPSENFLMVPYDYNSVMEYAEYAFSSDKQKTIIPKKAGVTITPVWKRPGLDDSDVISIKRLYECDGYKRPEAKAPADYFSNFTSGWGWIKDSKTFDKLFERVEVDGNWVIEADTAKIQEGYIRFLTDYVRIKGNDNGCFSFLYKVTGKGIAYLTIEIQDSTTVLDWKEGPFSAGDWTTVKIGVKHPSRDFRFFATLASDRNNTGKMYIDDIKYHYGKC